MQKPFSPELYATRFSDPKLNATLKTKIALELRDSQELFQVAESSRSLSLLIPSLLGLLDGDPPSFSHKAHEQKLRSTVLEIINRLPFEEALRFQAPSITKSLFQIMRTDNEDNALASLKILADLFRSYKADLGTSVLTLFEIVREIYTNMDSVVRELFDDPMTPAYDTPGGLAFGSPKPSSPGSEFNDQSQKPIPRGMCSFKLLTECPSLLKPFMTSHKEIVGRLFQGIFSAAIDFLKIEASPQREARLTENTNGNYFVGVSPNIKNLPAFSDFIVAQIKTLGFFTNLHRSGCINLKQRIVELFEISLRLLCECPPSHASSKRDIFVSLNYLNCQEIRASFLNNLNLFMMDRVMDWTGSTARETIKCLSYTVFTDLILFFRADLSSEVLTRATLISIRCLHDSHLNLSMQKSCIRLVSGISDYIAKTGDGGNARQLLMHIFDAFATKLDSIFGTIPGIRRQLPKSGPPRPFASLENLNSDNIEDFDFEKMRPLWASNKIVHNAPELLAETCSFLRYMISCFPPLVTAIMALNPSDHPVEYMVGFNSDETVLFARLFRGILKCLAFFSLDKEKPVVLPLRARDGNGLGVDAPEALEITHALIAVFHKFDLAVFHDVMSANVEFFFDQFMENAQLGVLPKLLLGSERLGGAYLGILLGFLVEKLPRLDALDDIFCSRLLHLFGLAFKAVSQNPSLEHLLTPHLSYIVRACFDHPPMSAEGNNHYILLSVLFNNLNLTPLVRTHSEVVNLLPQIVTDLLLALAASSQEDVRDLLLELLLLAFTSVNYMTPVVHYIVNPIILSLNACPRLAGKALSTLETALDTVDRDLLEPILEPAADQLLYGVTKHLRPLPYDIALSASAARVLGKLGAVNRAFLLHPPRAESLKSCEFSALLEFDGRPQTFSLNLSQYISLSLTVLMDPTADRFYKAQAFQFSKSCLSLFIKVETIPSDDLLRLREKVLVCLEGVPDNAMEFGAETRFLPTTDSHAVMLRRGQRARQGSDLQKVLTCILAGTMDTELKDESAVLVGGLAAHFALIKVTELLGAREELAGEMAQRVANSIDSDVLVDVLVNAITDSNHQMRQIGVAMMIKFKNNCVHLLGGDQHLARLPIFSQICERLSACCQQEDWVCKERAHVGLTMMARLGLGQEWLLRHEPRIVSSLLHVLKATASTRHYETIWNALTQIIVNAHEVEEGKDRTAQSARVVHLAGRVLPDLFSANNSLRSAVKAILQLCVRLSGLDMATLVQPFAAKMHSLMFMRPIRSLPVDLMAGAFDAIAFLLDARPNFISGEDHLLPFIAESLALLDSEDTAFKARDDRVMTQFRVNCMLVIMAALSFVENFVQPTILRARAIRVFFKFMHSDTLELADTASRCLKQLMINQNKLPKDLLQDVLKPYLGSISDPTTMSMPLLKGLARLLEILTNYFKPEIGFKLLDCLRSRAEPSVLKDAAEAHLPDREDIKMLAALINAFSQLPPTGRLFINDLVPATLDMEGQLRRSLVSPFRPPLIRLLCKNAEDAVQYFYEHLSDDRHSSLFVALVNTDSCSLLCSEIMAKPEQLIKFGFDPPAHRVHFVGIVRACCRLQPDWLVRCPIILERLVGMWRSPERLQSGTPLTLAQLRETALLGQLLSSAISQDASRISLLFDLATTLSMVTSADLSSIRQNFRQLALKSKASYKRAILAHFLQLPTDVPAAHLATFLHYIINPMLLVSCVRGGDAQFLDQEVIAQLHARVWEGPLRQIQDDYLRLGTIQMTTILIQYVPNLLGSSIKEVMRFGIAYLHLDNVICRMATYLLMARFIAAFGSSDNIFMMVYTSLLKANTLETKPIARLALDSIVTVLPTRQNSPKDDPRFPIWIRYTKQSLGEDIYNTSHMISIFQFMNRHPSAFFEFRMHFIPQMIFILPKLGRHTTNPDSKGLLVQLGEMLVKWEKMVLDQDEPRAKRPKLAPEAQKDLTPLMKDIAMAALIRLFCSCGDPLVPNQCVSQSLNAVRELLALPTWSDVSTPPSLFTEILSGIDSEASTPSVILGLELLHTITIKKSSAWIRANLRGLRECLMPCIRANNYSISCALHPLLCHVFSIDAGGDPELAHLQAIVEESVQKGLGDMNTLGSALTLLDTLRQAEAVDPLVATLARYFQRLAKEHISPSLAEKRLPPAPTCLEQLQKTYPTIVFSSTLATSDSHTNSIVVCLNVLKRRISHLGDYRKTLLSSMGLLLEKSHDQDLLRFLFQVVSEWLLNGSESFPTAKEKANLLVSMVDMGPRCDQQLLADYLQLILDVYEDKALVHSELTVKLESAFMLGTRTDPPTTRCRFLALLDNSIPRPLPLRLKYILGVHDWERLASHFWISQATYLLAGTLRLNAKLVPTSSSLTLPSVRLPAMPPTQSLGEIDQGFQREANRLWDTLKSLNVSDLVLPAQNLASLNPALHSELWSQLFSSAWATLSEVERSDTVKLSITLLSKPYHLKQATLRPNVVQSLLAGLEECRPYVILPPQLVKYLASKYHAWFESIKLLEGALIAIDANPDKDDALIRGSVEDALSDLFTQLGMHEDYFGLWARRCKYPVTGVAIKLTQFGLWGTAQSAFEQAQSLASKSTLPSCESEYCVWEKQWVHCTERLQQWDILQELGEASHCPEMNLRSKWHNMGFNTEIGSFQTLLTQVDPLEVSPAFTPQLRLYHALAPLGNAHKDLTESVASFSRFSQLALQEIAAYWCLLPQALSHAHIPLLTMCQQLTEASTCPPLFNQLASTENTVYADKVLALWRTRTPRPWDPLSVWADHAAWRQFIYSTISRFIQPMVSGDTNPESPSPVNALLQKVYHEQACLLNKFAQAARTQHQYRVCIEKLSKHYDLPNMQVSGAFTKLMEHAKCYYAHASELEKGLTMLSKANLSFFSAPQKVEYFALKGQFLAKLGQNEEANHAFSTATQNGLNQAEAWAAWGQFNEDLFMARKEMELGVFALNCYIQAAGIFRSHKSRRYIAKTIYLLNLDDAKGSLANSLEPHKSNLPFWYWIFFIPQLLNGMTQQSAPLLKFILLQIAKWHPQALFFNMSTAREEYSILRSLAKQPDGEESDSDVYKQAWDCLTDVFDSIKINVPLFSMSAVIFQDALSNCPRPTPTEEFYQLTSLLTNEAIMLLCNRASQSENLLAPYSFSQLASCAKALPPQAREVFEAEFIQNPPNLMEFVSRMRKWRDQCETLLPKQSKHIFLDTFSTAMVNAEASGLNNILIPGQYFPLSEESRELIKVSRFLPRVQVIYRHCVAHYKLSIRGHNGQLFSFLMQNNTTHISRREECITQLAHCMNDILIRNEGAVQRRLQFHLPQLIPIGHSLRMVRYEDEYVSFYEMYDEYCSKAGIAKDTPYLHNLKRLQETPIKSPTQMLSLRQEIFAEITQMIPPNLAANFLMRRLSNHAEWWAIRSHLTSQLALTAVLSYTMSIGCRLPSQMLVSPQSGELWLQEAVPILNQSLPTLQTNEPVPFRFTPALQGIITKRAIGGLFTTSIVSSARALAEPISPYLPLFMRDEYLFWMTFKKTLHHSEREGLNSVLSPKLDPTIDPLKESHDGIQKLVDEVAKRLDMLSCNTDLEKQSPKSSKPPLDYPVTQLISYAANPAKLSQMDYSLMPWL